MVNLSLDANAHDLLRLRQQIQRLLFQFQGQFVPSGGIIMWSGLISAIPDGYFLCDGTNGTPDLREKFVMGWTTGVNPGGTGGATTHTHDAHGALSHSGGAVGDAATGISLDAHTTLEVQAGTGATVLSGPGSHTITDPEHDHPFTQPSAHAAQSHSSTNHLPPYCKLVYLMKA